MPVFALSDNLAFSSRAEDATDLRLGIESWGIESHPNVMLFLVDRRSKLGSHSNGLGAALRTRELRLGPMTSFKPVL